MGFPRTRSSADIYHVTARGTGKQIIFEDRDDNLEFLSRMSASSARFRVEIYAWCLMSNHIHLLLHAPIESVSEFMRILCGGYARYFNERHGRSGHLFEERFWSEAIEDDERLLLTLRYIHRNPDKAEISRFDEYEWSSFHEYLSNGAYCSIDFCRSLFGSQHDYYAFHEVDTEDGHSFIPRRRRGGRDTQSETDLIEYANGVLRTITVADVKSLDRASRDARLADLKRAGLTARQIERLTGVSKSVVSRA